MENKRWKILYEINEEHKIIAGNYIVERKKVEFNKLNLGQINGYLKNNNLLDKDLSKKIDKVRTLRNDQHFGTHNIVKNYTKKDLDLVFAVAKDVKDIFK